MNRNKVLINGLMLLIGLVTFVGCSKIGQSPQTSAAPGSTSFGGLQEGMEALRKGGDEAHLGQPKSTDTYTPDKMYEVINGEADLYLSYYCRGLVVARYQAGNGEITAELFDQAEPLNAFGVFGQVRGTDSTPVAVGAGAVSLTGEEDVLFWKANFFGRVVNSGEKPVTFTALTDLAQKIADNIQGSSRLPQWTTALPTIGAEGGAVQYVAQDVLGLGFLSTAMLGRYQLGGRESTLVLARGEDEAKTLETWVQLTETYQAKATDLGQIGQETESLKGTSPDGSTARILRAGQDILVLQGDCEVAEAQRLLKNVLDRLKDVKD